MTLRILSAKAVVQALPMKEAIDAMRRAFAALASKKVEMPLRTATPIPQHKASMLCMPAHDSSEGSLGVKIVSVYPGNLPKLPAIHGMVLLLDGKTGKPKALLDGMTITSLRTGAVSGLATDLLSNPQAVRLAIIGSGAQAETQLEAVCCVRNIEQVWVYSRNRASAEHFVAKILNKMSNIKMTVASSVHEAIQHAEIICTATSSATPLVNLEDVKPGTHINAIGSYTPQMCEIDPKLVSKTKIIVDQRSAALAEAGEIIQAISAGLVASSDLIELGELVQHPKLVVYAKNQTTLFKSVGLAIQDIVAAEQAFHTAQQRNLGTLVEF